MEAGIVGLPNTGKSSLFNALTGAHVEVAEYPFTTTKPHIGEVKIPDTRLERLAEIVPSRKVVYAHFSLVDLPALSPGGEGGGRSFLADVQTVDALVCVARCFEDDAIVPPDGKVDPIRDVEAVRVELILADMGVLEAAIDRSSRHARAGDDHAKFRVKVCEKAQQIVSEERALCTADWPEEEYAELRQLGMLSLKPMLVVANIAEADMPEGGESVDRLRAWAEKADELAVVPLCVKVEAELAELTGEEHDEMLEAMGLSEPATAVVARAIFDMLGYQCFYTANPNEDRAWPVRKGATAPQAAGVVHSDFERGFIRVEVCSIDDLLELGSHKAVKEAGKMHVEGKNYIVREGDVCHFLFNV